MNIFPCKFVTPHGILFANDVVSVVAPAYLGEIGILAGHESLITILKKGIVKIKTQSEENFFAINSGSLEVSTNHHVLILADKAIKCETANDAKQKLLSIDQP